MSQLKIRTLWAIALICNTYFIVRNQDCGLALAQNDSIEFSQKQRQLNDKTDKYVPLNKSGTVLLDLKRNRLRLKANVVLREGLLEMLCCRKQTKEHESILSVDAKAFVIHTGLLTLGAKKGTPVRFAPKFEGPTGQRIDIFLEWKDQSGKLHRAPAQSWIRHSINRFYATEMKRLPDDVKLPEDNELRFDKRNQELVWYGWMSKKQLAAFLALNKGQAFRKAIQSFYERSQPRQMKSHWVFAGSGFFVVEKTGTNFYQAEGGDLICVANFPTAMLDVAIESSASGEEGLMFEAHTERIPLLGTQVTIELIPVVQKPGAKKRATEKKAGKSRK